MLFDNFGDAFERLGYDFLPDAKNKDEAIQLYGKYFKDSLIKKHGVVVIGIELIV